MKLMQAYKAWRAKREKKHLFGLAEQMHQLRLTIQSDQRWMAHSPLVAALTERYLAILYDGWEKRGIERVDYFRARVGLDPHTNEAREARKAGGAT